MQSELRKNLLDAFSHADGEYLSGQYLADLLNCSRTAIWKHIEELRQDGFEMEAVRKKGYRIIRTPDKVTGDDIRLGLKTKQLGQQIHFEETVDSTQRIALQLAIDNAKEGTIVIAEEQLEGRGRLTRKWSSPKETGIWMSIILRPNIPIPQAPQLTLLTAVALVQAIEDVCDISVNIKWPNDILINGKKVAGILTELQAEADQVSSIIIGIGVNVNQSESDFPEELRDIATSLSQVNGKKIKRAKLIRAILLSLENLYRLYLEKGFYPIKLLWESFAVSIGKQVTAKTLTETIHGEALGITEDGVLKLKDESGKVHHIYSADILLNEK